MDQPPKKRRWQFSLKVLLIVMTMAGVGLGLIRFGLELDPRYSVGAVLFCLGGILLLASPGVLIGYGYNRLIGAFIGGMGSVVVIFIFLMIVEAIFILSLSF